MNWDLSFATTIDHEGLLTIHYGGQSHSLSKAQQVSLGRSKRGSIRLFAVSTSGAPPFAGTKYEDCKTIMVFQLC